MSEIGPAERVALLALVYGELHNARYGERGEEDALYDDLEACPGGMSLLLAIGSAALPEFDWEIVRALDAPETLPALLEDLVEFDPRRAEALLHAYGASDGDASRVVPLAYLERWEEVEQAMNRFRDLGITATRDDVALVANRAYMSATGATLDETIDHYATE